MHVSSSLAGLALLGAATANNIYPRQTAAPSPTSAAAPQVTAVTDCHLHGSQVFCIAPNGDDVQVNVPGAEGDAHQGGDQHGSDSKDSGHQHCHFHAGVEHCVGGGESENAAPKCDTTPRDYNVGLRVGLLFVIMASSALGVFGPIFLHKVLPRRLSTIFTLLKQFGTGIIISTAFVHLFTHASLMFGNKCIGELGYEGTTAAILMAGIFLSFLVEYIGQRIVLAKTRSTALLTREKQAEALLSTEVVSILVMEAGILFHSLLIGLTLVVAGDSFFITLFIVILFHQVFEGLALGTRIATIGSSADVHLPPAVNHSGRAVENDTDKSVNSPTEETADASSTFERPTLSMKKKLGLASLFAFVTPIGMAIGIGVLQKFNGNDRSTLLAIGTLDALSAGILVWTGVVEMWAADWMTGSHGHKAELADADMLTVGLGVFGLVAGMVLMSFLGKWA
ncbi:Zinc/iron permease [Metarhizium guizhouense ARSEF 977]|uniref:Zinc/iron permease n=1 Tax=Metarhizium guizhouense (strain ARSEF 977) TaxID=1276136 RepID=A0A0B4HAL6_METGA|nr:Zinc/iron permease [Metarhizium guizhouense ARSEF 977]